MKSKDCRISLPHKLMGVFLIILFSFPTGTFAAKSKERIKKKNAKSAPQAQKDAVEKATLKAPVSATGNKSSLPLPPALPAVPPEPPVAPSIQTVQKQIDEVLQLNESLKVKYASQADEVRRITEQAKEHQKILSRYAIQKKPEPIPLPPSPPVQNQSIPTLDPEQIRKIGEETKRSKNYLETLRPSVQTSKPQAQATQ